MSFFFYSEEGLDTREPLNKSSAAAGGTLAPTYQFEKWEIHKVFLHFPNFDLHQNLSPSALADLIRGSLVLVNIVENHFIAPTARQELYNKHPQAL